MNTIIIWVCVALLIAIFIIAVVGIFRANKANKEYMISEQVACAGSVDNSYPYSVKVMLPRDPMKTDGNIPQDVMKSLRRFIVKGNSMQYADIHSDDLIYVKKSNVADLRHNLPRVTLLMFHTDSPDIANKKIRRTWGVINSGVKDEEFNRILDSILEKDQFKELRRTMGDKCPSNDDLKQIAFESLNLYRQAHGSSEEELLLSTTFRTERDRLEFSIHPSSSLEGVVMYVSHPNKR